MNHQAPNPQSIAAIIAPVRDNLMDGLVNGLKTEFCNRRPQYETITHAQMRTPAQKDRDTLTLMHNLPEPYGSAYRELIPHLPTTEEAEETRAWFAEQAKRENGGFHYNPSHLDEQRAVKTAVHEVLEMITDWMLEGKAPIMDRDQRRRFPYHIAQPLIAEWFGPAGVALRRAIKERENAVASQARINLTK